MIYVGDALGWARALPDGCANAIVTSPPYYGLRDYGTEHVIRGGDAGHVHEWRQIRRYADSPARSGREGAGFDDNDATRAQRWRESAACVCGAQRVHIGQEVSPADYVRNMVELFAEMRRALRDDGIMWLNLGDSYASNGGEHTGRDDNQRGVGAKRVFQRTARQGAGRRPPPECKPKDLLGIPWLVAFALRADGWHLRSDVIWHKPNPMPESVTDRPTRAHEHVFLLSKSPRYWYDAGAISEPSFHAGRVIDYTGETKNNRSDRDLMRTRPRGRKITVTATRNRRDVWSIPVAPFAEAHFATMPPEIARLCVLSACPSGGLVLDPFTGAGTTAVVALTNDRRFQGAELNPQYAEIARRRIADATRQGRLHL